MSMCYVISRYIDYCDREASGVWNDMRFNDIFGRNNSLIFLNDLQRICYAFICFIFFIKQQCTEILL